MYKKIGLTLAALFAFTTVLPVTAYAKTITGDEIGTYGEFDYELWRDKGDASMTLNENGAFECVWDKTKTENVLFRTGKKFDTTKTHEEIGNITLDYGCDYQPDGNSYLCVYGWSVDPLVEFYVVEAWGTWRPPGATSKGTVEIDGGTYDIYETTRTEQPSIQGTATFQQYWSVRTDKKTNGTISVSEHFKAWESMDMYLGNLYEVALCVEGYKSSGTANVYSNMLTVGDTIIGTVSEPPVKATETPTAAPTVTTEPTVTKESTVTDEPAVTDEPDSADKSGAVSPEPNIFIVFGIIAVVAGAIFLFVRKIRKR